MRNMWTPWTRPHWWICSAPKVMPVCSGTDAVRDGVDVPGDHLRLIVMDRVPWSTPNILEKARKEAFGGNTYVDMTVRLRLRQAFGRLIRAENDKGCFVVLDPDWRRAFQPPFQKVLQLNAWVWWKRLRR